MEFYKVRIDLSQCDMDQVVAWIREVSPEVHAYVKEKDEENPHVHGYLQTAVKLRTLRSQLRKLAGSGNGRYSLKEVSQSPIEYLAYMLKEAKPVYVGLEDVLEEVYAYNEKVKEGIQEKKEKKKTQLQKVEEYAISSYSKDISEMPLSYWVRLTVEWFKVSGSLFREFQVISISQTLFLKHNISGVSSLSKRIIEKMEK